MSLCMWWADGTGWHWSMCDSVHEGLVYLRRVARVFESRPTHVAFGRRTDGGHTPPPSARIRRIPSP